MKLYPKERVCGKCKRVYVKTFEDTKCPFCKIIERKDNLK